MENGPDIVENAARIAVIAHKEQKRKDGDTPYVVHPFMVAFTLARYGFRNEVVAAALVHDVLEDTDFPEDELREAIGEETFAIVQAVTNDPALEWEAQRMRYIETVRNGPDGALAVSLADKLHNMKNLLTAHAEQGPALWSRFNRGKEKKLWFEESMLAMLKETWKHPMIDEYEELIKKMRTLD
jgi:(p)ppGpp synthase/HD superfamily hydrolase